MLTANERKWLNSRKADLISPGAYFCGQCETQCFTLEKPCPLQITGKNWRDAAEFEQRVAAKLADPTWTVCRYGDSCIEYGGDKEDAWIWLCEVCRIKYARLQVEEEMDDV